MKNHVGKVLMYTRALVDLEAGHLQREFMVEFVIRIVCIQACKKERTRAM
jgi:hypothetical protein